MATMRQTLRLYFVLTVALTVATLSGSANAAEKLKGFYSGSGGISAEVHRVLLIDFAADGTALLQQHWHEKTPQTWHAHWTQKGKLVQVIYDPIKDQPTPDPLLLTLKHGTLTPTSWDTATLGPLGPPKLAPFGGDNPQVTSVASCQALNSQDPSKSCITWDSRH
jgi:hypothetical protein